MLPLAHEQAGFLAQELGGASWSAITVGSSPKTSSPTSAAAIALRMASVGRETVSGAEIDGRHQARECIPGRPGASGAACSDTPAGRRVSTSQPGSERDAHRVRTFD